jgi:hypothetical protein
VGLELAPAERASEEAAFVFAAIEGDDECALKICLRKNHTVCPPLSDIDPPSAAGLSSVAKSKSDAKRGSCSSPMGRRNRPGTARPHSGSPAVSTGPVDVYALKTFVF